MQVVAVGHAKCVLQEHTQLTLGTSRNICVYAFVLLLYCTPEGALCCDLEGVSFALRLFSWLGNNLLLNFYSARITGYKCWMTNLLATCDFDWAAQARSYMCL